MYLTTYKFRRNVDIGSLDAENDRLLLQSFVDKNDVSTIQNMETPKCILLGRTGAGKSAIIRYLENNERNIIRIQPESISLRHLSNSNIINYFKNLDVKLDLFYKVLWKHVFIVELIKLYFNNDIAKSKGVLDWIKGKFADKKRQKAIDYLEQWEDKFWEDTEYRIKELETSLECRFKNEVGGSIELAGLFSAGATSHNHGKMTETVRGEIISKAQKVVNESQIEQIRDIIQMMKEELFNKRQQRYFIIIDDLDKEWVSNSIVYDLIKALIDTIKELSEIPNVKIIIALRTNINKKVFHENLSRGMQREKYNNLYLDIQWSKDDLRILVNNRLRELMKGTYTNHSPKIEDVLPAGKKFVASGFEYMIERTLMRPRDIIDYFNKCIKYADGKPKITMEIIKQAEDEYSNERLKALNDEWLENYGDLSVLYGFLRKSKQSFLISDITETGANYLLEVMAKNHISRLSLNWRERFDAFGKSFETEALLKEILIVLYDIGILGIKVSPDRQLEYSHKAYSTFEPDDLTIETKFYIHPMFHRALRVGTER